jgi:hypothetical protein
VEEARVDAPHFGRKLLWLRVKQSSTKESYPMSRGRKIVRIVLVACLLVILGGYLGANVLLHVLSGRLIASLQQRAAAYGVELSQASFGTALITGLRSVVFRDVTASLRFLKSPTYEPDRLFEVRVERVAIRMGYGHAALEAQGIQVDSTAKSAARDRDSDELDPLRERVEGDRMSTQFEFDLLHPVSRVRNVFWQLLMLTNKGKTELPVDLEGTLAFPLRGVAVVMRLSMREEEGEHWVILNPEDVRLVSGLFDEPLTPAEIGLISHHALRTPRLLRIKEDAESAARAASKDDAQVPEDAYRHVLWSFLLTQAFGAEFARSVTDAHEEGDTGNTEAERQMDYHNNGVGRRYAGQGVSRSEVLGRVMSDPRVIRQPGQVVPPALSPLPRVFVGERAGVRGGRFVQTLHRFSPSPRPSPPNVPRSKSWWWSHSFCAERLGERGLCIRRPQASKQGAEQPRHVFHESLSRWAAVPGLQIHKF